MRFKLTLIASLCFGSALAQDLVITNARVIDGTDNVIEEGSVVVEGGRIVSVAEGPADAAGAQQIDAAGMTVMPGLIDTHVHVLIGLEIPANQAALDGWIETQLQDALDGYLAAGLTTVGSSGDFLAEIVDVRERLRAGELRGPRLLSPGPAFTAPGGHPASTVCRGEPFCVRMLAIEVTDAADARENVRRLAAAGVNAFKIIYDSVMLPDAQLDLQMMVAVADEAKKVNVPSIVHIQSTQDALDAAEAGVTRMVHIPSVGGALDRETAARLFRDIPVSTTTHVLAPLVDETGARRNHFGAEYPPGAEGQLNENLANLRQIWDVGGVVAFGTDQVTGQDSSVIVMHEIETLSRILSPAEVVASLTRNAATYLGIGDETGTLEPGKVADIVIIDGDPLSDPSDLANVKLVLRNGEVVFDQR